MSSPAAKANASNPSASGEKDKKKKDKKVGGELHFRYRLVNIFVECALTQLKYLP
jgi:hypothetical protein